LIVEFLATLFFCGITDQLLSGGESNIGKGKSGMVPTVLAEHV
jgi:hypothetical protein